MKVLAINGSPRGANSNTDRLLLPFLEGAQEAGAETEVVYLADKQIEHCQGCFTCWTETPGVCIHEDDMAELLEKVPSAAVLVLATPLYIYTVSGLMKDFLDRLLPLMQPYIIRRGDHFIHPPRYPQERATRFVLISNAGFPERHHFSGLEEMFRRFTDSPDWDLAGMICCAGGELLRQPALQDSLAWYREAAKKAGREVVAQGSISAESQAVLDRPLVANPAVYADAANAAWVGLGAPEPSWLRKSASSPGEPAGREAVALPPPTSMDTLRDLVAGMAFAFNPAEADDLEAVIQFDVTDEDPGQYYLDVAGRQCRAFEGVHANPTLTIRTPAGVWMKISRGEMNGAAAMMTGKYTVKGNLGLLMRLNKLFSAHEHPAAV